MGRKKKCGCHGSKSHRNHVADDPSDQEFLDSIVYFNKNDAQRYQMTDEEIYKLYQMMKVAGNSKFTLLQMDHLTLIFNQFMKVPPARVLPNIKFSDEFVEMVEKENKEQEKANPDRSVGFSKEEFNSFLKKL